MKRTPALGIAVAIAIGAALPACASSTQSLAAHANAAYPARETLSLDQGRKWATDASLRRHMDEIRIVLAQHREPILRDKLTVEQERTLARVIENKVASIMTDCDLEPRADANLHLVMAELVQAADILNGKARQEPRLGATRAVRAAQMYATYFDHPGWSPIF